MFEIIFCCFCEIAIVAVVSTYFILEMIVSVTRRPTQGDLKYVRDEAYERGYNDGKRDGDEPIAVIVLRSPVVPPTTEPSTAAAAASPKKKPATANRAA